MSKYFLLLLLCIVPFCINAKTLHIGKGFPFSQIKPAIEAAEDGDSLFVHQGIYKEGNILIRKAIAFIGVDYPVLDGQYKYEVLSIKANGVLVKGFKIIQSGSSSLEDISGIKVYNSYYVTIEDNILEDNFFAIFLDYNRHTIVKNNRIRGTGKKESQMGNGIHCWKSDSLQIIGNTINKHRDGIYFEFVTGSVIWNNTSTHNARYGLHFMFSNDDIYVHNFFKQNGAGVAVMYSKRVSMYNNVFVQNWGDASYGLMLKEIYHGFIRGNKIYNNTTGILMDGASRLTIEKNIIESNGWGMKIMANCTDNVLKENNFLANTFDMSTNGTLVLNTFNGNYWDKYEGYDLNRDGIGDVPFHPLSIFSVIVEKNPPAMILFRSFLVSLLDRSEKLIPSLTPDNFVDEKPLMKKLNL